MIVRGVSGTAVLVVGLALVVCLPATAAGQDEGRITGVVVSEGKGLPIPRALIALDAGIRADADEDGVFQISGVRAGPYRIAAVSPGCHVGLGDVEVVAGKDLRLRLVVPLPPDAESRLDRWTLGTRSLGESVKSLDAEQMRRRHVQTVQDAVRIIAPDMVGGQNGAAGAGAVLRNRGAPTVTKNPEPLVIIDGIPITQRPVDALATINVDDLERVEVMRGGAGGWRYGIQGANGVVRITTRDATGGFSQETPARQCAFTFNR